MGVLVRWWGVLSIQQLQLPSPAAAGEGVLVSGGA